MWLALVWGLFWFTVGMIGTGYILNKKGHDPVFGAILAGLVSAIGNVVALAFIWIWLWYFLPQGTFRRYNSVNDLFRRR
jgi:amino acid transporter